jgi:hypothetical protein
MRIINKTQFFSLLGCMFISSFIACNEENPDNTLLKNDCIKWSNGPNLAGLDIEFAYAAALPYQTGKIVSVQVEADIPGAPGTWMENNSYYTAREGQIDVPVLVGEPSVTEGKVTKVDFIVDTCAATLRYYYKVPEEAKGKSVSFTFSATASNGETASYRMGSYLVSKMDMQLDLTFNTTYRYVSIEDMAIYNATEAATRPEKIDLVYVFKNYNTQGVLFLHSFAAPAADPQYLPDIVLPTEVNRDTKIRKGGPKDAHLSRLHLAEQQQPEVYIDDIDLINVDLSNMPNYALNFIDGDGMWVETQDGKYKAYIYVEIKGNTGARGGDISIKRYTMK